MAITVKSPYSGRPVKVRDQDIGRAIRDEAGRVFYVVPLSEGGGYYAARTRKGSAKEQQAYLQLQEAPQQEVPVTEAGTTKDQARAGLVAPHDATGKGRGVRPIVWVILLILIAVVAYLGYVRYTRGRWLWQPATTTPRTQPSDQPVSPVSLDGRPRASFVDSRVLASEGSVYDKTIEDRGAVLAVCQQGCGY